MWIAAIQTNSQAGAMFEDQHEALLTLGLNCRPQRGLDSPDDLDEHWHGMVSLWIAVIQTNSQAGAMF